MEALGRRTVAEGETRKTSSSPPSPATDARIQNAEVPIGELNHRGGNNLEQLVVGNATIRELKTSRPLKDTLVVEGQEGKAIGGNED